MMNMINKFMAGLFGLGLMVSADRIEAQEVSVAEPKIVSWNFSTNNNIGGYRLYHSTLDNLGKASEAKLVYNPEVDRKRNILEMPVKQGSENIFVSEEYDLSGNVINRTAIKVKCDERIDSSVVEKEGKKYAKLEYSLDGPADSPYSFLSNTNPYERKEFFEWQNWNPIAAISMNRKTNSNGRVSIEQYFALDPKAKETTFIAASMMKYPLPIRGRVKIVSD